MNIRFTALPGGLRRLLTTFLPLTILVSLALLVIADCLVPALSPGDSPSPDTRLLDSRPNVIVILADDLGYHDVGFNGPTDAQTPNLDRLAAEGIRFPNGYVASPLCSPSRAALLTGRHPARIGWEVNAAYSPRDHHHGLDLEERLVSEYLQEAGYATGIVGKWHLGSASVFNPLERGFDRFYGFTGGGHDYWTVDVSSSNSYLSPLHDGRRPVAPSGYLTDVLTGKAIDFVRENRNRPLFLYLSYNAPHFPMQAPPELVREYGHVPDWHERVYLAMVESLDQNVRRLLDTLEELGIRENTAIFFLSDNGLSSSAGRGQPLRGYKSQLYEGGIRVPFAASWPAEWPQGMNYAPMVSSMDIAATALSLAGVEAVDPERPLDGVNLDPFLRGEQTGVPHEALFWRGSYGIKSGAVRSGDMKLVSQRDGPPQLYNLSVDVAEADDLAEADREAVIELAALWNEWNAEHPAGAGLGGNEYKDELQSWMDSIAERRREAETLPPHQIEVD